MFYLLILSAQWIIDIFINSVMTVESEYAFLIDVIKL